MILTVTANPLLDRMLEVENEAGTAITRGRRVYELAGGKGINVSRALHRLGYKTLATGFVGGYAGKRLCDLLQQEHIPHAFQEIAAPTRIGLTLHLPRHRLRAFYDPPPEITSQEQAAFLGKFPGLVARSRFCIISGSLPGGASVALYNMLIATCRAAGVPCLLDTYGPPLVAAAAAGADSLKLNRREWMEVFAVAPEDGAGMAAAVAALEAAGTKRVVVSDEGRPGWARAGGSCYRIVPPAIHPVSALGSGDCLAAAMAAGLLDGLATPQWLALAFAAGSANAEVWDPATISTERVRALLPHVQVEKL